MGACFGADTHGHTPAKREWQEPTGNHQPKKPKVAYNPPPARVQQPRSQQLRQAPTGYVLPAGWEMKQNKDGRVFYVNHNTRTTHWQPPEMLPQGWEKKVTSSGRAFYVDHNTRKTHWHLPPNMGQNQPIPQLQKKGNSGNDDEKKLIDDDGGEILLISRGWSGRYTVNQGHVHKNVAEVLDHLPGLENVNVHNLLKVFDRTEIKQSDLDMWTSYSDGKLFLNKSDARNRLKTVCDYISGTIATKKAKQRLKFIAKELFENSTKNNDPIGILLLLASRGGVCNVMKEVGIQSAYSSITNQSAAMFKSQTIDDRILSLLVEFREVMVEELYSTFGAQNNTHSITLMRNHLAPYIGVEKVHDTQAGNWGLPSNWQQGIVESYFNKHYTVEAITRFIVLAMNEEPRKISYDVLTRYLESSKPIDDTYLFYTDVYDMESGQIKDRYVKWILVNLGVFNGPRITFEVPKVSEFVDNVPDGIPRQQSAAELKSRFSSAAENDIPSQNDMNEKNRHDMVSRWQSQYEIYSSDPALYDDM